MMSEKAHSTVNGIHGSNRTNSVLLKDLDDYFVRTPPVLPMVLNPLIHLTDDPVDWTARSRAALEMARFPASPW